jgi:hypothetical protein
MRLRPLQIAAMRVQSEANLASEFGSKLAAARSIPDAMIAGQEWATRRFEMMAEDRKHATDWQMFTETGARLLSKGWLPSSRRDEGFTAILPG